MPGQTSKWHLETILGADVVQQGDDTQEAAMERLDLLLGEQDLTTITPSAIDVTTSLVVMYSRTYPTVPRVFLSGPAMGFAIANQLNVWVSNELVDRFTLNIRSYNTVARDVRWWARPGVSW